jgi:hypothetical protein
LEWYADDYHKEKIVLITPAGKACPRNHQKNGINNLKQKMNIKKKPCISFDVNETLTGHDSIEKKAVNALLNEEQDSASGLECYCIILQFQTALMNTIISPL